MDTCACTRYCHGCGRTTQHESAGPDRCQCVACGREVLTTSCEMRRLDRRKE